MARKSTCHFALKNCFKESFSVGYIEEKRRAVVVVRRPILSNRSTGVEHAEMQVAKRQTGVQEQLPLDRRAALHGLARDQ